MSAVLLRELSRSIQYRRLLSLSLSLKDSTKLQSLLLICSVFYVVKEECSPGLKRDTKRRMRMCNSGRTISWFNEPYIQTRVGPTAAIPEKNTSYCSTNCGGHSRQGRNVRIREQRNSPRFLNLLEEGGRSGWHPTPHTSVLFDTQNDDTQSNSEVSSIMCWAAIFDYHSSVFVLRRGARAQKGGIHTRKTAQNPKPSTKERLWHTKRRELST